MLWHSCTAIDSSRKITCSVLRKHGSSSGSACTHITNIPTDGCTHEMDKQSRAQQLWRGPDADSNEELDCLIASAAGSGRADGRRERAGRY